MASKAELPGRKTNHSSAKTSCTKLPHAGVAPTTIQQLTGHRNVQSVNNDAIASSEMQHQMSDILSNKCDALNPVSKQCQLPNATTPTQLCCGFQFILSNKIFQFLG